MKIPRWFSVVGQSVLKDGQLTFEVRINKRYAHEMIIAAMKSFCEYHEIRWYAWPLFLFGGFHAWWKLIRMD